MTDSLLGSSWWRNKRQQATASQTEISMSTQPAEIEVSHVNWSLWEQNGSIPHRRTEKPPATMGPEYYSRHHRNIQQTIYCVLLLLTGSCEPFVRYMVEMERMEVQSCTVTSSLHKTSDIKLVSSTPTTLITLHDQVIQYGSSMWCIYFIIFYLFIYFLTPIEFYSMEA